MNRLQTGSGFSEPRHFDTAFTDPLTGLGNARRFFAKVAQLINERADDPAAFAIAILDLDGFKPINDLLGRAAGDHILMQVAMRLRASIDDSATVTRIGADEFAFLFPLVFSEEAAEARVRTLIEILSAPYDVGERNARLSASAGCAVFLFGGETAETLVSKAESALYLAKRAGRSRVLVYSREMEKNARWISGIDQALRRAISAGEIEPHFQPIVDLATRRTLGFEILARWTDRDLGPIAPDVFIPIAEERAIVGPLSQLVLRKATQYARHWPEHLFLSVNLSPSQLTDRNTGLHILSILQRAGFETHRLEVEITETGVVSDPDSAHKIVSDLRMLGIRVVLDDFGTGQSSLARLKTLRFDKLKIDRSFVSTVLEDRASEHIVRAIIAMCAGFEIPTVAEGIETEAQAAKLFELGCTAGQGYYFGRAADAKTTLSFLRAEASGDAACRA